MKAPFRLAQINALFLLTVFALHSGDATAQTQNLLFQYNGAIPPGIVFDQSQIHWDATDSTSPGFHLEFYGRPDPAGQCAYPVNKPGPTVSGFSWANSSVDTGIADGAAKWAPACQDPYGNMWQGISYARVNQVDGVAKTRGIGLYTHSGPKPWDNGNSFFMPYSQAGDQNGANPFIEGVFAIFRFDPAPAALSSRLKPWGTTSSPATFAIDGYQDMIKAHTGSTNSQAQQKLSVTILNPSCLGKSPASPVNCQFQLLFFTGMIGINSAATLATVYADPSQGGIPVIFGPIQTAGVDTFMACPNYGCQNDVWTSWANPTQHSPFSSKYFNIQINFTQFLNILAVTTAAKLQKPIPSSSDLINLYGSNYADPSQWMVLDVSFSQEVYNPDLTQRVYVGGGLFSLDLYSLTN